MDYFVTVKFGKYDEVEKKYFPARIEYSFLMTEKTFKTHELTILQSMSSKQYCFAIKNSYSIVYDNPIFIENVSVANEYCNINTLVYITEMKAIHNKTNGYVINWFNDIIKEMKNSNKISNNLYNYTWNPLMSYCCNTTTPNTGTTILENQPKLHLMSDNNINGGKNMINNFGLNLEFGKIKDGSIALSMNGLAFKDKNNSYVVYNTKDNSLTDVSNFILNIDMIFAIPAAMKSIKVNDIIKHNSKYVIVSSINEETKEIMAIDPFEGTKVNIIPKKNVFGFNYVTKIVNFMENMFSPISMEINEDNPFGNFMPYLLMSSFGENNSLNKSNDNDLLKFFLLSSMSSSSSEDFDFKKMLPFFLLNK